MTDTKAKDKANAAFKKEERIREGNQAMAEYQSARLAEIQKIERLKSLRLAKAATESESATPVKRKPRRKRTGS